MNHFATICAALQLIAALEAIVKQDYKMTIVWLCFSISGFILASK